MRKNVMIPLIMFLTACPLLFSEAVIEEHTRVRVTQNDDIAVIECMAGRKDLKDLMIIAEEMNNEGWEYMGPVQYGGCRYDQRYVLTMRKGE